MTRTFRFFRGAKFVNIGQFTVIYGKCAHGKHQEEFCHGIAKEIGKSINSQSGEPDSQVYLDFDDNSESTRCDLL